MLQESIFLFEMQEEISSVAEYEEKISFGGYEIRYCAATPMLRASMDDRELLIYGYAVDVRSGEHETLAERILGDSKTIDELLENEYYLGGKYLLFYKNRFGTYVIPDATASIPFCYSKETERLVCASNSETVAKELSLEPDKILSKIRKMSEISQAMPYDTTVYREVAQLLPNHYFVMSERKAKRVVIANKKQPVVHTEEAAERTQSYIENLISFYKRKFHVYCAITSGRDSRVILAYLLAKQTLGEKVETYTIKHSIFSENEPDIVIPKLIAKELDIEYQQLSDLEPAEDLQKTFNEAFGKTDYSKRTLMIANTIKCAYGNGAVLNGDIIGQVGKCSLHRDIPEILATPRYFRCKLHNFSKESLYYIKKWMLEIKASGERVNLFDLFSIENRMGRWAAQENLIYNMLGQLYLNPFNARCIVYVWTCVPRQERKLSKVHLGLIEKKYPKLLNIPFEPETTLVKIAKWNGLFYYLSSFAKYYIQKMRFGRGEK